MHPARGSHPARGFVRETGRQAVVTLDFLSGFSLVRQYWKVIRQSNQKALHGDQQNAYWTASMTVEHRNGLAARVLLEGILYFVMGTALFVGGVWHAADAASVDGALFWVLLSLLAAVVTMTISTLKAWQASNVRTGQAQSFRSWFYSWKGHS
jgi:hypothetical protein